VAGRGHMSAMGAGLAGLRVRIPFFPAREQISVGFRVMPALAPAGKDSDPYPRPSGFKSAGTRIFRARCHLYPSATKVICERRRCSSPTNPTVADRPHGSRLRLAALAVLPSAAPPPLHPRDLPRFHLQPWMTTAASTISSRRLRLPVLRCTPS
jgi:hypothetical protein